jgi:thiamine kinase-like enzyme
MGFLDGQQFDIEQLPGGLTNRNYRVHTSAGQDYVARFSGAKSDFLAIDRDAEAHNSRVAAGIEVGPEVVEYTPERRLLVVRWLEARTLDDAALDDEQMLARVAETCRRLHAGPRFFGDFDMFDVQRGYLDIVREHGFRLPDDYFDFVPQVRVLDEVLHASSTGTVACHNDLLAANIMDDGAQLWLIDYEYSGNNDACFELGNIWSEAVLDTDRLEHLVTAYFGRPAPVETARARLFALMANYGWTLWASIQDAVSEVDFDFWQWGMAKYVRAREEFRSPELEQLISTVQESIAS